MGPDNMARILSDDEETGRILNRLARIEGQVRGLQRMVEEGKECEAILTQLAAVRSALDRVGMHLISHRMKDCLEDQAGVELDPAALDKAFDIFLKYVQCMR
ncbi:MAG: metal-sensitive transcriptional regulator [Thermoleophilia bacterium]|nr:metal-sensitive transcriptional regulator [Thermoleophilia bacterium]